MPRLSGGNVRAIACADDGKTIAATGTSQAIYITTDGGMSWVRDSSCACRRLHACAACALTACVLRCSCARTAALPLLSMRSADALCRCTPFVSLHSVQRTTQPVPNATFSTVTSWAGLAMSKDGKTLLAAPELASRPVYVSYDLGQTWCALFRSVCACGFTKPCAPPRQHRAAASTHPPRRPVLRCGMHGLRNHAVLRPQGHRSVSRMRACMTSACWLTAGRLSPCILMQICCSVPHRCRVAETAPAQVCAGAYISPSWVTPSAPASTGAPAPTSTPSVDPSQYVMLGTGTVSGQPPFTVTAFRSTDAGWTWTDIGNGILKANNFTGPGNPDLLSAANDGSLLVVSYFSYVLLISRDLGDSWSALASPVPSSQLRHVRVSANGSVLLASAALSNKLQLSHNGGQNWTGVASIANWAAIAMSNSGCFMAAGSLVAGPIWVSSDYGVSWRNNGTGQGVRTYLAFTMSSDGQRILAANSAALVLSTDGGITWANVTVTDTSGNTARAWRDAVCSADGMRCAAVEAGGYVWMSVDGGSTVRGGIHGADSLDSGSFRWALRLAVYLCCKQRALKVGRS